MAIIYKGRDYCFIDHREYINLLYQNVSIGEIERISHSILAQLFSVVASRDVNNKKRSYPDNLQEETMIVQEIYERFFKEIPSVIKERYISKYNLLNTSDVRELAKKIFESTVINISGVNGGNNSEVSLKCRIKENDFLLPPHSRFYCGNVHDQCQKLKKSYYDMVIADPPWWNKYIRRLKSANDMLSYSMMYNEDIASIPLKDHLSENCLVAVWCTNSESNIASVKNLIFPKWGVEYVATWYWLKVTVDMKPMCEFRPSCKKQPYERLIIGKVGDIKNVPENQVLVSVPSALHSHKPPLLNILAPYVNKEDPQILELFARYLLPNTTSIGYEPLKWQHISLFEEIT